MHYICIFLESKVDIIIKKCVFTKRIYFFSVVLLENIILTYKNSGRFLTEFKKKIHEKIIH